MASVSSNSSPQSFSSRNKSPVEDFMRKSRTSRDENFPEVPKVIEDGNGKRYFRGRMLGKVIRIKSSLILLNFNVYDWRFIFKVIAGFVLYKRPNFEAFTLTVSARSKYRSELYK